MPVNHQAVPLANNGNEYPASLFMDSTVNDASGADMMGPVHLTSGDVPGRTVKRFYDASLEGMSLDYYKGMIDLHKRYAGLGFVDDSESIIQTIIKKHFANDYSLLKLHQLNTV